MEKRKKRGKEERRNKMTSVDYYIDYYYTCKLLEYFLINYFVIIHIHEKIYKMTGI